MTYIHIHNTILWTSFGLNLLWLFICGVMNTELTFNHGCNMAILVKKDQYCYLQAITFTASTMHSSCQISLKWKFTMLFWYSWQKVLLKCQELKIYICHQRGRTMQLMFCHLFRKKINFLPCYNNYAVYNHSKKMKPGIVVHFTCFCGLHFYKCLKKKYI